MGSILIVNLTDKERMSLRELAASETEPRIAKRAQIVLCATRGMSLKQIEAEVGLGWQSCLKWRKRFLERREKGLYDELRQGRPAKFDAVAKQGVINKAIFSRPRDGSDHWSLRKLAAVTGLSRSTIHRTLNKLSFKPHKVKYWSHGSSTTVIGNRKPNFLGFYLSNFENAVAFSLHDEEPCITFTEDPSDRKRMFHPASEEFWNFLERISRLFWHDEIHLIVNSYDSFRHDKILQWASKRKQPLNVYFTPPHFPWRIQILEVFDHHKVSNDEKWRSSEEDLLRRLLSEICDGEKIRATPYEWICPGRLLLPEHLKKLLDEIVKSLE
jgi:transposase